MPFRKKPGSNRDESFGRVKLNRDLSLDSSTKMRRVVSAGAGTSGRGGDVMREVPREPRIPIVFDIGRDRDPSVSGTNTSPQGHNPSANWENTLPAPRWNNFCSVSQNPPDLRGKISTTPVEYVLNVDADSASQGNEAQVSSRVVLSPGSLGDFQVVVPSPTAPFRGKTSSLSTKGTPVRVNSSESDTCPSAWNVEPEQYPAQSVPEFRTPLRSKADTKTLTRVETVVLDATPRSKTGVSAIPCSPSTPQLLAMKQRLEKELKQLEMETENTSADCSAESDGAAGAYKIEQISPFAADHKAQRARENQKSGLSVCEIGDAGKSQKTETASADNEASWSCGSCCSSCCSQCSHLASPVQVHGQPGSDGCDLDCRSRSLQKSSKNVGNADHPSRPSSQRSQSPTELGPLRSLPQPVKQAVTKVSDQRATMPMVGQEDGVADSLTPTQSSDDLGDILVVDSLSNPDDAYSDISDDISSPLRIFSDENLLDSPDTSEPVYRSWKFEPISDTEESYDLQRQVKAEPEPEAEPPVRDVYASFMPIASALTHGLATSAETSGEQAEGHSLEMQSPNTLVVTTSASPGGRIEPAPCDLRRVVKTEPENPVPDVNAAFVSNSFEMDSPRPLVIDTSTSPGCEKEPVSDRDAQTPVRVKNTNTSVNGSTKPVKSPSTSLIISPLTPAATSSPICHTRRLSSLLEDVLTETRSPVQVKDHTDTACRPSSTPADAVVVHGTSKCVPSRKRHYTSSEHIAPSAPVKRGKSNMQAFTEKPSPFSYYNYPCFREAILPEGESNPAENDVRQRSYHDRSESSASRDPRIAAFNIRNAMGHKDANCEVQDMEISADSAEEFSPMRQHVLAETSHLISNMSRSSRSSNSVDPVRPISYIEPPTQKLGPMWTDMEPAAKRRMSDVDERIINGVWTRQSSVKLSERSEFCSSKESVFIADDVVNHTGSAAGFRSILGISVPMLKAALQSAKATSHHTDVPTQPYLAGGSTFPSGNPVPAPLRSGPMEAPRLASPYSGTNTFFCESTSNTVASTPDIPIGPKRRTLLPLPPPEQQLLHYKAAFDAEKFKKSLQDSESHADARIQGSAQGGFWAHPRTGTGFACTASPHSAINRPGNPLEAVQQPVPTPCPPPAPPGSWRLVGSATQQPRFNIHEPLVASTIPTEPLHAPPRVLRPPIDATRTKTFSAAYSAPNNVGHIVRQPLQMAAPAGIPAPWLPNVMPSIPNKGPSTRPVPSIGPSPGKTGPRLIPPVLYPLRKGLSVGARGRGGATTRNPFYKKATRLDGQGNIRGLYGGQRPLKVGTSSRSVMRGNMDISGPTTFRPGKGTPNRSPGVLKARSTRFYIRKTSSPHSGTSTPHNAHRVKKAPVNPQAEHPTPTRAGATPGRNGKASVKISPRMKEKKARKERYGATQALQMDSERKSRLSDILKEYKKKAAALKDIKRKLAAAGEQ